MADANYPSDESLSVDAQLNPYHLHHSYSSSNVLVTQPLVGASNYSSWRKAMLIALSGKNKEGFIDGTLKKPEGRTSAAWKCNNDIITSWILNSVSKEIAASINYTGSVKAVWDELHTRFKQSNGPHVYQLQKELVTTSQGSMSVESYYTKLKTIWQDLIDYRPSFSCSCDGIKPFIQHLDSEFVMIFLMGLSDSFAAVRAQILLMTPIPSIESVFSLIIQEERQRSVDHFSSAPSEPIALAVDTAKRQNVDRSRRKENQRPNCTHCNIKGHTVDKCYKIHGYPPGYKFRNSNSPPAEVAPKTANTNVVAQSNFFSSLNATQYTQLMDMLSSHIQAAKTEPIAAATAVSHTAGQVTFDDDWQG